MRLTGIVGRVVYALLAGIVAFILLLILGVIIGKFDSQIGDIIQKFAAVVALLVGLVYFFARPVTPVL